MARKAKTNADNKIVDNEIKVIDDKDITVLESNNKPVKHAGGRPLKFPDPVAFDNMIDSFFVECEANNSKPTIERLAVHMGAHRETISLYENIPQFSVSVKKAKDKCLEWLVSHGLEARNPAMDIFLLKNCYGYRDKIEVDNNINVSFSNQIRLARERAKMIDVTPDDD